MAQERDELRIPIRLLLSAHPALFEAIVNTPRRYRSERIRNLMEKGLKLAYIFDGKLFLRHGTVLMVYKLKK